MRYDLLGAVSTVAMGAAFDVGTPGAANAALVCTSGSGNTVGSFSCAEGISAGYSVTPVSSILSLDKWVSNASAGFSQTLKGVTFTISESLMGYGSTKNTDTVSVYGSFFVPATLGAQNSTGAPSNFHITTNHQEVKHPRPATHVCSWCIVPVQLFFLHHVRSEDR
jgi:hypothetical protein